MTTEELEAIRARTRRAEELITTIDKLEAVALPDSGSKKAKFYKWNTNEELWDEVLLMRVIELGRTTMLARLKEELSAL